MRCEVPAWLLSRATLVLTRLVQGVLLDAEERTRAYPRARGGSSDS